MANLPVDKLMAAGGGRLSTPLASMGGKKGSNMMNDHAIRVLDAYLCSTELAVPHAVLIEGSWGSGKTHFLQHVYEPRRKAEMLAKRQHHVPFLFVSLFGATSASDVELRIYKTACPGEAVAGSIAGTIALGIGEFFRVKEAAKGAVDKLGKKAIKRLNDYVFVFDDLERLEKEAFAEVMGLINSLVADHGRRVLLVADEEKLKKLVGGDFWKDQNEKVVGRRALIEADFESVIRSSVSQISNGPSKALFTLEVPNLLEVARTSGVKNLRNLSWAVHNAAAFVDALIADAEIPKPHIVWTMKLVVATTLWLRSGLLDSAALERVPGLSRALALRSVVSGSKEKEEDPELKKAKDFADTFATLSVDAPPIDYRFIREFEGSGVIDGGQLISWIKGQFGFGNEYSEASWRKLWYSHERPIAETEQAIADLRTELIARHYTDRGPILHAAGLAIRLLEVKDDRLTDGDTVVDFFKAYIDEIADMGLLEKSSYDASYALYDSYGGLGFSARETDEFKQILGHLRLRSQDAAVAELEARAEAVIAEAEAGDLEALFKFVRNDDYELSRNPILANFPVDRLADLMARDVPQLNAGAKMLAYRYHHARDGAPLLQEIKWARDVYAAVLERLGLWAEPHRTMAVNSMNGLIRHYEQDKQPDDMIIPPANAENSA